METQGIFDPLTDLHIVKREDGTVVLRADVRWPQEGIPPENLLLYQYQVDLQQLV